MMLSVALAACGGGTPGGDTSGGGTGAGGGTLPIAGAVTEQRTYIGSLITLDGSSSTDPDGNPLTYRWSVTSKPADSTATISSATGATTNITPDKKGIYTVALTVNNGTSDSVPLSINVYSSTTGMTYIPDGCFNMGDADSVGDFDEVPVHNVCLTGFYMDEHEITNLEYKTECLNMNRSGTTTCTPPSIFSSSLKPSYYDNLFNYLDYPVIYVDQLQASAYCQWLGKRLPTEAEWEYAARGGLDGKPYPWGEAIDILTTYANFTLFDTVRVGSYAANDFGLFDMAGNVAEWTNDSYDSVYYSSSPVNNPEGPLIPTFSRVVRGASWNPVDADIRVASRTHYHPLTTRNYLGFRCVEDK